MTLITRIKDNGARADLERYLREKVAPDGIRNGNITLRRFRFDKIESMHFCSMLILNSTEDGDAGCLVFEATFDGSKEDFLDDLLRAEPGGLDTIYKYCEGYPQARKFLPELVKEYFLTHDVGANTFYCGSPGRTVAQIKGEYRMRDEIVSFIQRHRLMAKLPDTFRGLQSDIQQGVIRKLEKNRWAEQVTVIPWEVSQRSTILLLLKLLGIIIAIVVGYFILKLGGASFNILRDFFLGWSLYKTLPHTPLAAQLGMYIGYLPDFITNNIFTRFVSQIPNFMHNIMKPVAYIFSILRLPYRPLLASIVFVWNFLRFFEFFLFERFRDPRTFGFFMRYLAFILYMFRLALIIPIAAFAILLLDTNLTPSLWVSIPQVIVFAVIFGFLRYIQTTLRLKTQFRKLKASDETVRGVSLDFVRFLNFLILLQVCLIILQLFPTITTFLQWLAPFALTLNLYLFVGAILVYVAVIVIFCLIRLVELLERRRFAPASELVNRFDTPASVYQREEGSVHKYQNHLASLTYVKPGILRSMSLRLTLLLIGLLAKYWFNRGTLGDIPTILAARWVIINGNDGERLLFLTNYGGALDSYLNEFIDMAAVRGLNAIWTNTFVKFWSNSSSAAVNPAVRTRGYAFPETKFYLWGGAEDERPFKAYVRQSQVETIVWYSAYPTLTTQNVNATTDLRQALFQPLASDELDAVFLKSGL
jgi:hypothetical protein